MGSFGSNSVDDVVMTWGTVTAVSTSVIALCLSVGNEIIANNSRLAGLLFPWRRETISSDLPFCECSR
jgi:hypothetical protein